MFSLEELNAIMNEPAFKTDISSVHQSLVNNRLQQPVLLFTGSEYRLAHFAEAVLASAPDWPSDTRFDTCRAAAEISETLAAHSTDPDQSRIMRIRAALLYELAALPALSASILNHDDLPNFLIAFFERSSPFDKLNGYNQVQKQIDTSGLLTGVLALLDDAQSYGKAAQQNDPSGLEELRKCSVSSVAWKIGEAYDLGLTASEIQAFATLINERIKRSTIGSISFSLIPFLRKMGFPAELFPAQRVAIDGGLLNPQVPSWGFAAPTGAGKTFLARLLIVDILSSSQESKVLYLVPSRALVSEVANALNESLAPLDYVVLAISAQLVDLEDREKAGLDSASVIVMTPEKADMLLRLGAEFLQSVTLVVIDEAHHIEFGTRGALLELYLWRLTRMLRSECRYVFLSAVAPNIVDIVRWINPNGKDVTYLHRSTRMRVGIYQLHGSGVSARSTIKYSDGTSMEVVSSRAETRKRRGICQLAEFLHPAGPVLVVAKGKKECENIAIELRKWLEARKQLSTLSRDEMNSDTYKSLDASLEREMYSDVPLRGLVKCRIAYHHAGLPPNVRYGVEKAIRDRHIDYVIATTTLAEGVNFPFSSVIVQSLALREPPESGRPSRYSPVTPRTFWNIAGRAGRPGFDAEGQVILYEPSLGLDKINAVVDPYLKPEMASLAPVKSALATAFKEIQEDLKRNTYSATQLEDIKLPDNMSRSAKGAINLLRIGIMHAKAAGIVKSPEDIVESLFAVRFLSDHTTKFVRSIMESQDKAINFYLSGGDVPGIDKLAELGLSLETLNDLSDFVHRLEDWQLENCERLFYRGTLNLDQAQYIIGPVAKRMSELEGPSLGGFLSDVIVHWLSGVTFTSIRAQSKFEKRLEDLIAVIYSRVQYLLPWGLWATDWLIEQESERRKINYDNQVKNLAYLADAGVPNFNALRLTQLSFERVDSTRLSFAYSKAGGLDTGVDCVGWVISQPPVALEIVIRGQDNRRIEHGFFERIVALRSQRRKE